MAVALLFWAFLLTACILVLWFGTTTERAFTAFLVACSALTLAVSPKLGVLETRHARN